MPTAEVAELTEMLSQLYTAATSEECDAIARDMAAQVQKGGLIKLKTSNILTNLEQEAKNKKSGMAREGALIGICALADVLGRPSEPFLLPLLPTILDLYADKGPVVQDAASRAALAIMAVMPSQSTPTVLPILFQSIGGPGKKWQTKVGALQLLADLSNASPIQVGIALPEIIPIVKDCLSDTKKEVQLGSLSYLLYFRKSFLFSDFLLWPWKNDAAGITTGESSIDPYEWIGALIWWDKQKDKKEATNETGTHIVIEATTETKWTTAIAGTQTRTPKQTENRETEDR